MLKHSLRLLAVAAFVSGSLILGAPPASAATARNGICEDGEICFYTDGISGTRSDHAATDLGNYGTDPSTCYVFTAGPSKGDCIKNRVGYVWNRANHSVRVHFNSYYGGVYEQIAPDTSLYLSEVAYENASHDIYPWR